MKTVDKKLETVEQICRHMKTLYNSFETVDKICRQKQKAVDKKAGTVDKIETVDKFVGQFQAFCRQFLETVDKFVSRFLLGRGDRTLAHHEPKPPNYH